MTDFPDSLRKNAAGKRRFFFSAAQGGYAASLSNFERGIGRKPEKDHLSATLLTMPTTTSRTARPASKIFRPMFSASFLMGFLTHL